MASSSSSSPPEIKYDVFLSFRGDDTRNSFTSHLLAALRRESIETFIDDDLIRGEEISQFLLDVIEKSMISVVIFSEEYASSRWCLEELAKIIQCRNMYRRTVIPIFYHVDPSHVRNQTGTFQNALDQLQKYYGDNVQIWRDNEQRWKNALTEAANLSGFHTNTIRSESVLVEETVKHILEKLNRMSTSGSKKSLVGVRSSIMKIKSLLRIGLKDVHMVGIWGMGGIGKTSIAKAIFDKIYSQFNESYFAENVREGLKSKGPACFQNELLSKNSNKNFASLKRKSNQTKVIIVLDDIKSSEETKFLIGDLNCLGSKSRIIITTRDKQVLKSCGVHDKNIFKLDGLFQREALELFNLHAFKQNHPIPGYHKLSDTVTKFAKGVPLALEVLGSHLYDKSIRVWESAIKKFERSPHKDIQEVLKVSCHGLDSDNQNIFLDIACFFNLEDIGLVTKFLVASNFAAEDGITTLIDKCLISISNNKIVMHDLLQKMGWEIVRELSSSRDKGEHSRLCYYEDISSVFKGNQGTHKIEGICLDMSGQREMKLSPHVFTRMINLRFLKVYNSYCNKNDISKVDLSNRLESTFTALRYLCWHGCPLHSLQSNLHLENLVVLDMPHSNIQLWDGFQILGNLVHINLSHSKQLLKSPDFSRTPNLESLVLEGCTSLVEICSSIQNLNKLVSLNLRYCKSLRNLPEAIHSKSLRRVILSCCSSLETFPTISWNVEELLLDGTSIQELPLWIKNPSRLVILNLKNCSKLKTLPSSIPTLAPLQHLNLSGCSKLGGLLLNNLGNSVERFADREVRSSSCLSFLMELNLTNCCIMELPNSLGQLSSLRRLLLGKNKFKSIPESIICLSKLSYLDLDYCESLQSLPKLPCHLQCIDAHNCKSLEASQSFSFLYRNILRNSRVNFYCLKLDHNELTEIVKQALLEIQRLEDYEEFYSRPSSCICYPGTEVPKWFTKQITGSSITLELPSDWFNFHFAMGAVVEFNKYHDEGKGLVVGCYCKLRNRDGRVMSYHGNLRGWYYGIGPKYVDSDHVFLGYDFHMCPPGYYNKMSIRFYVEDLNTKRIDRCQVKKCGIHLLNEKIDEEPRFKRLKTSNCCEGESTSRYTR